MKVFVLVIVVLGLGAYVLLRPRLITIDGDLPDDFPRRGFSHLVFEELLEGYVDDSGDIDYERWHRSEKDRITLDAYLTAVGRYSPETSPERFATEHDALAYWLYAYNAYVIRSVLHNWPLESVTNIRGPVEFTTGFGFFYRQRFLFGGRPYSLYAIETDRIRRDFRDARIHFVLSCASGSCPVVRPELPTGDALESMLNEAASDFVSDTENVRVSHAEHKIYLNDIFRWYEKDFINDLRKHGLPATQGLVGYVASVAPPEQQASLRQAAEYDVVFMDYDWSLNQSAH